MFRAVVIAAMAAVSLADAVHAAAPPTYACYDESGGSPGPLRVTVQVEFSPAAADRSGARYWKNSLDFWALEIADRVQRVVNGRNIVTGNGRKMLLEMIPAVRGAKDAPQPDFHQIGLHHRDNFRDYVDEIWSAGGPPVHGEWSAYTAADLPAGWAHETGHLLGFPDRYGEFLRDASGKEVAVEVGTIDTDDGGNILDKDALRRFARKNRLDLASLVIVAHAQPGAEQDIMGNPRPATSVFTTSDLATLQAIATPCLDARVCTPPADPAELCELASSTFYPYSFVSVPDLALTRYPLDGSPMVLRMACTLRDEVRYLARLGVAIGCLVDEWRQAYAVSQAAPTQANIDAADQRQRNVGAAHGEFSLRAAKALELLGRRAKGYRGSKFLLGSLADAIMDVSTRVTQGFAQP